MNSEVTGAVEDLQLVKLQQIERPKKTFFYEKEDGEVFACNEQEAALFGRNYRLIGVSDGTAYNDFIKNSGIKKNQVIPIQQAREILQGAFEAELAQARGKKERPQLQNVHFDTSFPMQQRATFVPPA